MGGENVRAFHGSLLNQMEQSHLSWADCDQILKFRRAVVWHTPSPHYAPSSAQPAPSYPSSGPRRYHQTAGEYKPQPGQAL